MSGQGFYWSMISILVAVLWTDFIVDEYILRRGFNVVVFGPHLYRNDLVFVASNIQLS